jgi:hypothetical protein
VRNSYGKKKKIYERTCGPTSYGTLEEYLPFFLWYRAGAEPQRNALIRLYPGNKKIKKFLLHKILMKLPKDARF